MASCWRALLLYACTVLPFCPVGARDLPGTGLSFSGGATLVSDYRFRGISQSNRRPSLQLGLELEHRSGVYAGLWGATIDLYDDDPASSFDGGSDIEIDYYAGWRGDIAPHVSIDASFLWYDYPGVTGATDYAEMLAAVTFDLGAVETKLGGGYFPDQPATADGGAWAYGELSGTLPGAVTLTGHVGRQFLGQGFGPDASYWEWSLVASRDFGPVSASLGYVDTDLPTGSKAGATLVATLGIAF